MRLLAAFVIGLVLGGSLAAGETPAEPLTKPGEQDVFDGKVKLKVVDDGTVSKFEVRFAGSGGAVANQFEAKSAAAKGWFVVAESASRVWLYRGGDDLFLLDYTDNPPGGPLGGKSSTLGLSPGEKKTAEVLAKAPKSVTDRLPASFKLPAKDK